MPEHVLMFEIEIITGGSGRRRWSAAEKLRIAGEALDERESKSSFARRNGAAANLLYRWRRLMLEGGSIAVTGDDEVTSNKTVRQMEERIRELERQLGARRSRWRSSRRWTGRVQSEWRARPVGKRVREAGA
jgi:transposase